MNNGHTFMHHINSRRLNDSVTFEYWNRQENIDAKHQIRRPEIGCKLNKLADRTNLKVTHYPFLVAILVK